MSESFRRRALRRVGWVIGIFASFLAALLLVIAGYLLLVDYPEKLRQTLESQLTALSGAPAKVSDVDLYLPSQSFELRGVSVGAPGREEPVLTVERLRGRLRLSALLGFELRWSELVLEGVSVSLFEDRETGLVLPSGREEAQRLGGITLAADNVSVSRAFLRIENERIPWTLDATNAAVHLRRVRSERYEGRFTYDEGLLTIKNRGRLRASVSADFEIVPNELFLRRGTATTEFGQLSATGKVSFAGGAHARFDVEADGESGQVAEAVFGLDGGSTLAEGRASFRGTLTIDPESKTLEGTVVLPEGRLAGVPLQNWSGEVFWDRSLLSIGYARGNFAGGSGMIQLQQPLPVAENRASLMVSLEDAALGAIAEGVTGSPFPLDSRVSGQGTFSFEAEAPEQIEGSFELAGLAPPGEGPASFSTPLSFRARGAVSGRALEIDELALETPFLEGEISGTYPREGPASLAIDVASSDLHAAARLLQELSTTSTLETPPIEGSGRAVGRLRERLPHLVFEGELEAENLRLESMRLGGVRLTALVSRDAVTFQRLLARLGEATLSGRGSFFLLAPVRERDFELDLDLSRWPLSELSPVLGFPYGVEGAASGKVAASRRERLLAGGADLALSEVRVGGFDLANGKARVFFEGKRIRLEPVSFEREGSVVSGNLALDLDGRGIEGRLTADGLALEDLVPASIRLAGAVEGDVELSGTVEAPAARLTGRGEAVELHGLALGAATIEGEVHGKDLALKLDLEPDGAEVAIESTVLLADDFLARGHLEWRGLDVAPWLGLSREKASTLAFTSNGSADFQVPLASSDPLRSAAAEAEIASLALEGPGYRVASVTPARMVLEHARIELSRTALVEATSRLFVGGSLDLSDSSLDVEAEGVVSLGILQSFYPEVATTGETSLSARIAGTLERPSIEGHADFDSGSIRLEGFRQALGGLRGRVVFDNRTLRFEDLEAVFGSGPLAIGGTIVLDGLTPGSIDLTVRGSGVRLRYPEGLVATLEGDLAIAGSPSERMVSGNLTLTDALWSREYDLVGGFLSDRESEPLFSDFAENELLKDLRLDVRIRAPGSLQVRNSLAVVDASAELELRGTLGEPVLLGRSEASRGEIYFLGQRYDITSGKVDFVNPDEIEPFVDMTAETRVRSYRVELRLTGTPDRFYPELSSDPPLRTVDILRLLAGASDREILDTLVGNEAEELAGVGVASLLTERLSQEVGKRAERLFGLDRFSVNPFLVGQFANPTARVSLGKQITRELAINYSTNLNAATEAIILIEYTPEGPMSWILSRDEEGDIGIDVKFRRSF